MSLLNNFSNTLLHVPSCSRVSGELNFILDVANQLKEYSHTVLLKDDISDLDNLGVLNNTLNVYFTDNYFESVDLIKPVGIIYYDTDIFNDYPKYPSIYYSWHNCDIKFPNQIIPASDYVNNLYSLNSNIIIPPGFPTKQYRVYRRSNKEYSIGLISTNCNSKFNAAKALEIINNLPDDIHIYLSKIDNPSHPGLLLSSETRFNNKTLTYCPIKLTSGTNYISLCDILIITTNDGYIEPYSRTAVESMAFGCPVLAEDKGSLHELFEDRKNIIFFNTSNDAINKILKLKNNKKAYETIASNSRLRASKEDITIHIGKLKKALTKAGI